MTSPAPTTSPTATAGAVSGAFSLGRRHVSSLLVVTLVCGVTAFVAQIDDPKSYEQSEAVAFLSYLLPIAVRLLALAASIWIVTGDHRRAHLASGSLGYLVETMTVSGLLLAMVLTVGYATEIHELPELLGDAVNERITLLARFAHVAPDTAVVMLLLMPLMAICSLSPAVTVLEQARCGRALARSTRLLSGRRLAAVAIGYAAFLVVPFVERLFINILMPVVRPISEQVPGEMAIKVVWLPGLFVEVFAFCALGCLTVSIHRLKVPLDVVPAGAGISAGQMGAALPVAAAVPVPPPQAVPVASRAAFAATASDDAAPSLFLNTWFQFLLILAIVATAITIYNAVSEGAYGGF